MSNRVAFTDFVRGLLNVNPLERWSPQQAKLHPFITQQKFIQPFVPPMNLKSSNKPPAPGVQQQQQAEALSKQRAAQAQAQAQSAAQSAYGLQSQYQQPQYGQPPPVYTNVYSPHQQGAPPPYPTHSSNYAPQIGLVPQATAPIATAHYGPQQSLYAQATTRAGRQRASTMDQQQGGIPASIQRVASHLDPNAPIRLQPSPAYYPPPPDGFVDSPASARRRGSRNQRNHDFISNLEAGAMGDSFMHKNQWH